MKELRLFNSLGQRMETFVPEIPGEVAVYVCGPTVYNHPHIGNFRPAIVFDLLRRLLLALGYKVTYVSNYTDVDDKIINRAMELGISEKELTESVIKEYRGLIDELGCLQPDITPTPTAYMDKIIAYVKDLVDSGHAYVVGGDVYFRVSSVPHYGELSGNSVDSLLSGARIEVNSKKESPLDFALWKATEVGIRFDSPWGKGRPGWHTECCVMIDSIFKSRGGHIDIHGGGFDLKFPHHENEIAQSYAHNGNGLATYWLHNGFINIDNEKMSKSLGNVLLAKDVIAEYGAMAFRMMVLSAHYRAPLNFTPDTIAEAKKGYERLQAAYRSLGIYLQANGVDDPSSLPSSSLDEFLTPLCEDLNTPNALTVLYAKIKQSNADLRACKGNIEPLKADFACLRDYSKILGLNVKYPCIQNIGKQLYREYFDAKANKDFAKADELRGKLTEMGIWMN